MICGIVRGAGKQMVGAVCNLIGFYIIGLPIGASLMFAVKMGIVGEPHSSVLPKIHCIPPWFSVLHIYMTRRSTGFKLTVFSFPAAGLWISFLISLGVQSVFFAIFLWKLNWKKLTEEVGTSANE